MRTVLRVLLAATQLVGATGRADDELPVQSQTRAQALARWFDPSVAPFLPIPEIDTGPQSGLTLGLIPTVLRTNEHDEINLISAPDIIHSQYFGWGARGRMFGFPSPDTEWSVEGIYDRSGIPRFFGIGNASPKQDQTTYVDSQERINVAIGWNASRALQLSYVARFRRVQVLPGVLPGLPSIQTLFPNLVGLTPEHQLEQLAVATIDTRDAKTIPGTGGNYLL